MVDIVNNNEKNTNDVKNKLSRSLSQRQRSSCGRKTWPIDSRLSLSIQGQGCEFKPKVIKLRHSLILPTIVYQYVKISLMLKINYL